MKATSIFGGVQVFTILISIIRSKFIAILLGPTGMGISGLFNATISLVGSLSNFGLGLSAVKNVAAADSTGNPVRVAVVIKVLKRLVWITGLIGSIFTIIFSGWLSEITFGNREYTIAFIWLSATMLFNQLSTGQLVVLQGLRKLQYMAKASLSGSILGLFITIPIYYIWGLDGIVPAIMISSFVALARSWYFARKVKLEPVLVSNIRTIAESKSMLLMGLMISVSGMLASAASYFLRIFINNTGSLEHVGLYNAGFAVINTYVGLIFTAMGTDYFPRLSAVASDNEECTITINQQAEIAVLILAPIIMVFLVFINWVVILLYSTKFIAVNEMIHWAALGMFFKAASWSISFIMLAKGAGKVFFWSEFSNNIYTLALNIIGYSLMGLTGLGISFAISYLLYLTQVYVIARIKYGFRFNRLFFNIFSIQLLLAVGCFVSVKFLNSLSSYIIGIIFIVSSSTYSYLELDKRLNIQLLLLKLKEKYLLK